MYSHISVSVGSTTRTEPSSYFTASCFAHSLFWYETGAEEIAAVGGIETLVGLSLNDSQLETYAFRTVLRAIGHVEPLRQRVLDAHSAKMRQVRERASE